MNGSVACGVHTKLGSARICTHLAVAQDDAAQQPQDLLCQQRLTQVDTVAGLPVLARCRINIITRWLRLFICCTSEVYCRITARINRVSDHVCKQSQQLLRKTAAQAGSVAG